MIRSLTAMIILYTIAPLLFRLSSSAYFNLSLLSSDFYGLLFGEIFLLRLLFLELIKLYYRRVVPLCEFILSTLKASGDRDRSLALQTLLVVLRFLRHRYFWPHHLLLALYS